MNMLHASMALQAVSYREIQKFLNQKGRLFSALVRPALWLFVFAVGFQNVLGISIIPPYETYIEYQVYIVPGLLGIILLFNGMQSSLAMVYDREMGIMRLLLTSPLPRWYLLFCKLISGTILSVIQAYAFLLLCIVFEIELPSAGFAMILPALIAGGMMLGAIGLSLSVYIKQLENFAGTMNFVIFPMFFISSALYPLWKLQDAGAEILFKIAHVNPFTHAVELIRFSMYSKMNMLSLSVVIGTTLFFFALAVWGYDPQRSLGKRGGKPA